jgi:uncharacterized protein involved in response to NO
MVDARFKSTARTGPFLSYGFRPFFSGAGVFSALAVLAWLPMFMGELELPLGLPARDWHIHEMVYGYASAVIAGFLFTAIPNWTGRPPVAGRALLVLVLAWLVGRVAMAVSGLIGMEIAALLDLAFLPLVAAIAGREIVLGDNRRNLKLLGVLGVLIAGNVAFHFEILRDGAADYGQRIGFAAVIGMIMLIGGRIVPAFTRNALQASGPGRLPQPFGRLDAVGIAVAAVALIAWVVEPQGTVTGILAAVAGVLQSVRLARWAGDRARGNALVIVLHVAYGFVPLGFFLVALAGIAPGTVTSSAAAHAWGVGAIGLMTLAVMTRATLGHTGRRLAASTGTKIVYGLMIVAAVARIGAAFPSPLVVVLLHVAACGWIGAFVLFAAIYGPMALRPKLGTLPPGC